MPTWILWLLPIPLSAIFTVVLMSWRARDRGPVAAIETVEEYDRFRAALTSPLPHPRKKPAAQRPKAAARPKAPTSR